MCRSGCRFRTGQNGPCKPNWWATTLGGNLSQPCQPRKPRLVQYQFYSNAICRGLISPLGTFYRVFRHLLREPSRIPSAWGLRFPECKYHNVAG